MRSIIRTSLILAGVCLVSAGAASASTMPLEVKIPFSFLVKGETLPAGQYLIERDDSSTLVFIGENGTHGRAFVMTMPGENDEQPGTEPKLSFTRDGNHYRLSAVDGQEVATLK